MGESLSSSIRCIFKKAKSKKSGNKTSSSSGSSSLSSSDCNNGGNNRHHMHHHLSKLNSAYQITTTTTGSPSIPISICLMILISYIILGSVLFHKIQNWGLLESLYFCFTSLGTIGFGDLSPTGNLNQYLASAYILIGMAVVAMCFSLIQTELIIWLRKFGVQDQVISANDDLALVSMSLTPKS